MHLYFQWTYAKLLQWYSDFYQYQPLQKKTEQFVYQCERTIQLLRSYLPIYNF